MSEKLMKLAKLGLVALIDEATGYQNVRGEHSLRGKYIEFGGDPEKDIWIGVARDDMTDKDTDERS